MNNSQLVKLRDVLNVYFSYSEVADIMLSLGIDPEYLSGTSKSQKIREFIVYLQRHDQLTDLINLIAHERPDVDLSFLSGEPSDSSQSPTSPRITGQLTSTLEEVISSATATVTDNISSIPVYQKDIETLEHELAGLRQQTLELATRIESGDSESKAVYELVTAMVGAANRAVGRTEDLTAVLVPPENPRIRLLMEHDVDRLEEYRSDENIAFLLTGLFAGAAVSIFVNWATDSTFSPTPISITLLILFGLLALGAYYWGYRLKKRADTIHKRQPQAPNTNS